MFLNNYEIYSDERGNVLYMTIIFIGKTQCKDGEWDETVCIQTSSPPTSESFFVYS